MWKTISRRIVSHSNQEEESESEDRRAPCGPLGLPRAGAAARHTVHCRPMGTVWRVDQQLTCSCVWLPFLKPLFPSPYPTPPPQWKDFADWWTVTCKVEADPRSLCSWSKEGLMSPSELSLNWSSPRCLLGLGMAYRRETGRLLQSFGHAALCVTCQVLFAILCAQWCRSQAELLPGIWWFAVVKYTSLDLSKQRVKS